MTVYIKIKYLRYVIIKFKEETKASGRGFYWIELCWELF